MDLELTGKRALVTGGSRGIGLAIARQLALEGAKVAIAARDPDALATAARSLAEETGQAIPTCQVDTGEDASVAAMVDGAVQALGGLDILVNAAAKPGGQAPPPKLAEITDEVFFSDINVKVMGYLRCARQAAPHMIAGGWGRIINISGLAARQTGSTVGSIRNVAVAALTKALADELGPHGINVTVIHPGLTRTEKTAPLVALVRRIGDEGEDVTGPDQDHRTQREIGLAGQPARHLGRALGGWERWKGIGRQRRA
jgi:NAD(P)-dependent dehydrogenase (short-subunit alcohol dehydrogenase family)